MSRSSHRIRRRMLARVLRLNVSLLRLIETDDVGHRRLTGAVSPNNNCADFSLASSETTLTAFTPPVKYQITYKLVRPRNLSSVAV
jgi:hypothetical protein